MRHLGREVEVIEIMVVVDERLPYPNFPLELSIKRQKYATVRI